MSAGAAAGRASLAPVKAAASSHAARLSACTSLALAMRSVAGLVLQVLNAVTGEGEDAGNPVAVAVAVAVPVAVSGGDAHRKSQMGKLREGGKTRGSCGSEAQTVWRRGEGKGKDGRRGGVQRASALVEGSVLASKLNMW